MNTNSQIDEFIHEIERDLEQTSATDAQAHAARMQAVLTKILDRFDCSVGTIHQLEPNTGLLKIVTHKGLPPPVVALVETVPVGKGMAGIAAERRQPVQVCNLQTDDSGVVRPGARDTKMEGSIAVPALDGERLCGVLGVAKPVPYEFTESEAALLSELAALIGRRL